MFLVLAQRVHTLGLSFRISSHTQRWCSTLNRVNGDSDGGSLLVTYLTQNFLFTKLSAAKAAEDANMDNVNALIALFKEHGFTNDQMANVFRVRPVLLTLNPLTIKPKIEFLESKISQSSLVTQVITTYPRLLTASLEKRLIPSFNFLSTLLESEAEAAIAVRRVGDNVLIDPKSSAAHNLKSLINHGVPRTKILILLGYRSSAAKVSSEQFEEAIEKIKKMGFNPNTSKFVIALTVTLKLKEKLWDQIVSLYKKCGMSEEEFMAAFRSNPYIAIYNKNKITKKINYLKELGIEPCRIATYSLVLGMSFERRIIPRASVYKVLVSKGLLTETANLHLVFCIAEDKFCRSFIDKYDKVDGLRELYKKNLELSFENCTSS